jgi:hypothetical protein
MRSCNCAISSFGAVVRMGNERIAVSDSEALVARAFPFGS